MRKMRFHLDKLANKLSDLTVGQVADLFKILHFLYLAEYTFVCLRCVFEKLWVNSGDLVLGFCCLDFNFKF